MLQLRRRRTRLRRRPRPPQQRPPRQRPHQSSRRHRPRPRQLVCSPRACPRAALRRRHRLRLVRSIPTSRRFS
ncbi:MAG: hypothetical protein DWH97_10690 [Planctomycetota bacterium]|nr:MAG: hypothetical protein DWH97_10690 [Planctomycetota bacterium]RLS91406.1 MAG: hypothetical protein DWI12_13245 [Planctomycetota bacterium]